MKPMVDQLQIDITRLQQIFEGLSVVAKEIQGKHIFENMWWKIAF